MADLVVIVPSRNRPQAAAELAEAFAQTCTAVTHLLFALDDSDPTLSDYPFTDTATPWRNPSASMVEALNMAASDLLAGGLIDAGVHPPFAVGFMGDDHRPRTHGWDERYLDALGELGTGIVYGDDLLQRQALPTQCAMTADIITALGWMAPPDLIHMYVDNWWLQLGIQSECIRYLEDVIVEHVHPIAGKAVWDEGHVRVNSPEMYHRDQTAFARLLALELPGACAKIKALRGAG